MCSKQHRQLSLRRRSALDFHGREHFVCYQITEAPFRPRDVVTEDQFGKEKVRVGKPELFCVPASKTEQGDK